MSSNKYCVIMAGGIGTRFWPKSRQSMPKQFLDILGTGKSFIRHTYERFAKIVPAGNFLVVTNHKYKDLVLQHIPEIGEKQVLCEPIGRNTAPCIAYAAYTLMKRDPGAEMIVTTGMSRKDPDTDGSPQRDWICMSWLESMARWRKLDHREPVADSSGVSSPCAPGGWHTSER